MRKVEVERWYRMVSRKHGENYLEEIEQKQKDHYIVKNGNCCVKQNNIKYERRLATHSISDSNPIT